MKTPARLLVALMCVFCPGLLRARLYTIDFNRGTTSGASIKTSVKGVASAALCSTGADWFSLHASTSNCYYNASGCGIRIGNASGSGQAPFILTLCQEIQDEGVSEVVVYASRGTRDVEASFKVYAASTVMGELSFADMQDYDPSRPASADYELPGLFPETAFKNLQVEARNGNFIILHRIDIYTAGDTEDGLPSPSIFPDGMGTFFNLAGQRVGRPTKGFYIRDGRKLFVR